MTALKIIRDPKYGTSELYLNGQLIEDAHSYELKDSADMKEAVLKLEICIGVDGSIEVEI